jgi:lactoylglutathione lyase
MLGGSTLRIEHVAVWTADLERLKAFYAEHFGAIPGKKYVNPQKGFTSCFLSFASGARLELMMSDRLADAGSARHAGYAHLALSVGSEAEVAALTRRLKDAGVSVIDGPRRTGDGYYESVVLDPDGNPIEITV